MSLVNKLSMTFLYWFPCRQRCPWFRFLHYIFSCQFAAFACRAV